MDFQVVQSNWFIAALLLKIDMLGSGAGGHSHWKMVWGCVTQSFTCPSPHFQFFRKKICFFSLVLAKISGLKMQNFQIFIPKTPHFSRKICSLDSTFGNLYSTHPPKNSFFPPGLVLTESHSSCSPGKTDRNKSPQLCEGKWLQCFD